MGVCLWPALAPETHKRSISGSSVEALAEQRPRLSLIDRPRRKENLPAERRRTCQGGMRGCSGKRCNKEEEDTKQRGTRERERESRKQAQNRRIVRSGVNGQKKGFRGGAGSVGNGAREKEAKEAHLGVLENADWRSKANQPKG